MKFEDCAYEYKEEYCKPEECAPCGGYTIEQIQHSKDAHARAKEEGNSW